MGAVQDIGQNERSSPHQKPEIVAPGHRIISTGEENLWYSSSGTSDSTVFVTGALALLLEAQPMLKSDSTRDASCIERVKQALAESAQPMTNGGHDTRGGYGFLDAVNWRAKIGDVSAC